MRKRLVISAVYLLLTGVCYAQWSKQDSLKLKHLLEGSEELKLNPEAVKQIDFGNAASAPRMSLEKNWMLPDESLPQVLPKPKVILTLMPYNGNTRYNWDPVYQKKIRVDQNTWRSDPFYELRHQKSYSNWAHNPMDGGIRKSLDEIRSSGVRFNQLRERANGMLVNSVEMGPGIPLRSSGVSVNGGVVSGLDLMTVFTKDFWDRKGRDRRARALEVLKAYGDSTTISIKSPLEQIAR